jgi:hypothetical protein
MTIAEMALPLGVKDELTAKVPRRRTPKKAKAIGSLSPSKSGLNDNSHIPLTRASFPNSTNQTKIENPTPDQPGSTPEQSIHPSMPPERQALAVKSAIAPAALATAMGVENQIGVAGYRVFLDELIRESGNPSDSVENMLLEQIAMCHLLSMRLQAKASQAEGTEAIDLYLSGAARLSAEFRKTALALKEYRKK